MKQNRDIHFNIRLPHRDKKLIFKAASILNQSVSYFVRERIIHIAKQVIAQHKASS